MGIVRELGRFLVEVEDSNCSVVVVDEKCECLKIGGEAAAVGRCKLGGEFDAAVGEMGGELVGSIVSCRVGKISKGLVASKVTWRVGETGPEVGARAVACSVDACVLYDMSTRSAIKNARNSPAFFNLAQSVKSSGVIEESRCARSSTPTGSINRRFERGGHFYAVRQSTEHRRLAPTNVNPPQERS